MSGGVHRCCVYGAAASGALLFFAGIFVALICNEKILMRLLSEELALRDGTEAMRRWEATPQPVHFKVYLWNVTNPSEVSSGARPVLKEIGPYVYEQWLEKANVKAEGNDTLSYNLNSKMYFSQGLTGSLRESDVVTIIHLPMVGMVSRVNEVLPEFLSYLENVWPTLFPGASDIFLTGTVRELLFDGVPVDCTSKDFMITTICKNLEGNLPKTIRKVGHKDFRFSFFNYKNQTSTDVTRVYRGVEDITKLGETFSFNNELTMNTWNDPYCDMLNGSDGSQFPVNLKPDRLVYLFQSDICRSLYARFETKIQKDRVELLRFVNTPDLLGSPASNPSNECFCVPKTRLADLMGGGDGGDLAGFGIDDDGGGDEGPPPKTCLKNGAMLLTPCVGAPLVVTFPHFYMGDPSYMNFVQVKPEKELHQTFVDVEPMSGTPVAASKRVQFNIEVRTISDMSFMSNLSEGLFPALWVDESIEMTDENFAKLKKSLSRLGYFFAGAYACVGVGAALLLATYLIHAKNTGTLCWDSSAEATESQGYLPEGSGLRGVYNTSRDGLKVHSEQTSRFDYPVGMKRRGSRVFPNGGVPPVYAENFM